MSSNQNSSNTVDIHPRVKYLREKKPLEYNPWWVVTSILAATLIAIVLYVVPSWLELATFTRDIVLEILKFEGYPAHKTTCADIYWKPDCTPGNEFPWNEGWAVFGEAYPNTPGISIENSEYPAYWIVKACTGFQAGAILIALIIVTPIPFKGIPHGIKLEELSLIQRFRLEHNFIANLMHKGIVIIIFFLVLAITNTIRIWFHLHLVAEGVPFSFAHDDLSKPIGFVGTLFFAWVIEKSGVPIIDTFADWLDAIWVGIVGIYRKGRNLFS